MGGGDGIRGLGRIAWPGESGLNNAKPGLAGRQPGPYNPSEAKTPGEALSYIELLYKSGRMEDLAKLLRRSQVFRAAWLILQQSSPEVSEAAMEGKGSSHRESQGPVYLPVPASRPPSPSLNPEPGLPGSEAGKTGSSPKIPAAGMNVRNYFFAVRSNSLLQAYQNQDGYWARERQRGQLVNLRA